MNGLEPPFILVTADLIASLVLLVTADSAHPQSNSQPCAWVVCATCNGEAARSDMFLYDSMPRTKALPPRGTLAFQIRLVLKS